MASFTRHILAVLCVVAAVTLGLALPANAHSTQQWATGTRATPVNIGPSANGVRGGLSHTWALDDRNDYFEVSPLGGINEWCTWVPDRQVGVFDFGHACAHHDYCYMFHRYTTGQPATQSGCDSRFRADMDATCVQMHPNPFDPIQLAARGACLTTSAAYHAGVAVGGLVFWNLATDPGIVT
jgi:hypothetical protein